MTDFLNLEKGYVLDVMEVASQSDGLQKLAFRLLSERSDYNNLLARVGKREDPSHVARVLTEVIDEMTLKSSDTGKSEMDRWPNMSDPGKRVVVANMISRLVSEGILPPAGGGE